MTDLPTSSAVPRHRADHGDHGDRRVAGRWRRVVPLLLVVGLLGACARETVPQGLATSYLPPPPTTAPPTVVPTPTPTPTIAPTPASSPSPSPTDQAATDQAATDQAVDFVAGLETMAEEAGSYRLSGGGSFPDGDLVLDVRSQSDVDPPALDVTLATPGGPTTRTVLVDDDVYVQREDLTGPDEWLQASRNSPRLAEFVEQATQSARPFDLSTWREAATSVEVVGEQEGDNGVVLVRHEFTLDPGLAAEAADDPSERASYESVPGDEFVYDVWVDDRGFLRRVDYDYEGLALSFVFRAWGLEQGITAPDPTAIVTAPPEPEG